MASEDSPAAKRAKTEARASSPARPPRRALSLASCPPRIRRRWRQQRTQKSARDVLVCQEGAGSSSPDDGPVVVTKAMEEEEAKCAASRAACCRPTPRAHMPSLDPP